MNPILINEERKVKKNSVLDFVYFLSIISIVCIYKKNRGIFFDIRMIYLNDEFSLRF